MPPISPSSKTRYNSLSPGITSGIKHPTQREPVRIAGLEKDLGLREFAKLTLKPSSVKREASLFALRNFDFIGITEEYEASLALLMTKFIPDLDIDVVPRRVNPMKKVGAAYELDEPTREYLTRLLAPKLELYQEARTHFYRECALYQCIL